MMEKDLMSQAQGRLDAAKEHAQEGEMGYLLRAMLDSLQLMLQAISELDSEQQTANGEEYGEANGNEENEPLLSADCYFTDHHECQWSDCPCECHDDAGDE